MSHAHVTSKKDRAAEPSGGPELAPVQRKAALRGLDYAAGAAALAPVATPVQLEAQQGHLQKPPQEFWDGEMDDPTVGQTPPEPTEDRGQFAASYHEKDGSLQPDNIDKTLSYDDYVAGLGPLKASSESGPDVSKGAKSQKQRAAKVMVELTGDDLLEIYGRTTPPKDAAQVAQWQATNDQLKAEMPKINQAFRVMKLDTAGAQAHYLANAYMESSMLQYMTETQKSTKDPAFKQDGNASLNKGWLEDAADDGKINNGQQSGVTKVTGYQRGQSINKAAPDASGGNNWDQSFLGRGPLQVTHDHGYLQALGILEARLGELEALPKEDPQRADIALIAEALRAIKADPRMAADRRYTYLFSAAFMKRRVERDQVGRLDLGGKTHENLNVKSQSPGTSGMGDHSQVPESAKKKNEVFEKAVALIDKKNAALEQEQATAAQPAQE